METNILYDFIYSLLKTFEASPQRDDLIEGMTRAMGLFFPMCEIKIFLMDEYSFILKDFTKPWENPKADEENLKIKKYF